MHAFKTNFKEESSGCNLLKIMLVRKQKLFVAFYALIKKIFRCRGLKPFSDLPFSEQHQPLKLELRRADEER